MPTEKRNEIVELKKMEDKRGFLVEFLSAPELPEGMEKFSQIYVTTLAPGSIRGNHYHKNKLEWVGAVAGKIRVLLENVATGEKEEIILDSGDKTLKRVLVKASVAHAYENVADCTSVLVVYTNEVYDPAHTDTYEHKLL
jgi:dTDP-4-dehydrorhamnose 3,5-epimerase-like enzyme